MKPLVYRQNCLLPWPGKEGEHVWEVSVAPASLCNATHKISFDLFYPLLQVWDFPGDLQHWVCLSALVLQKEQPLCSSSLAQGQEKSYFCPVMSRPGSLQGRRMSVPLGNSLEERGGIKRYH